MEQWLFPVLILLAQRVGLLGNLSGFHGQTQGGGLLLPSPTPCTLLWLALLFFCKPFNLQLHDMGLPKVLFSFFFSSLSTLPALFLTSSLSRWWKNDSILRGWATFWEAERVEDSFEKKGQCEVAGVGAEGKQRMKRKRWLMQRKKKREKSQKSVWETMRRAEIRT